MIEKLIKLLLIFENIVGIYRNYFLFGKANQKLIILRNIVETVVACACLRVSILFSYDLGAVTEICYQIAINLNSLSVLVLSYYHRENFKKCFMHFNNYKAYFPNDQIIFKNLEKKNKVIMFVLIFVFTFQLCTDVCETYLDSEYNDVASQMSGIVYYIFKINSYIAYLRFIYECAVIYCFIFLIGESIGCITRSIENEIQRKKIQILRNGQIRHQIQLELFDKWSAAYATIAKISKLCNAIFGLQVSGTETNNGKGTLLLLAIIIMPIVHLSVFS